MKKLQDIMRIESDHLIIDCCPRNSSTELPIDNPDIPHCYGINLPTFNENRRKYTLYTNLAILCEISREEGHLDVNCHKCGATYRIEHSFLSDELNKIIYDS